MPLVGLTEVRAITSVTTGRPLRRALRLGRETLDHLSVRPSSASRSIRGGQRTRRWVHTISAQDVPEPANETETHPERV